MAGSTRSPVCIYVSAVDVEDVPTQYFNDGTIRRSFAATTLPGSNGGAQPIKSLEDYEATAPKSDSCQAFRSHLSDFRSAVDDATMKFAERITNEMGSALPKPLMPAPSNSDAKVYEDLKQIVVGGEHLEHFHSYQKESTDNGEATIEFHTDQGLFIAFTPGLIVSEEGGIDLSDGFYVQGSDGEKNHVEFGEDDDLVFMLGDGVNQFINNKLDDYGDKAFRATPHALTLRAQEDATKARVWYGLMVLPPNDAYDPSTDSTFGDARQALMDSAVKGESVPMGIGCSSSDMKAVIQTTSRHLDGPDNDFVCAEDELFCWFRCQKLEEYELSATTCSERRLGMQCISPRGHVIPDGKKHGDYYPACTNNTAETHPYEAYPLIEQQVEDVCTDEAWKEFTEIDGYDHMADLTQPNGTASLLVWSVIEDANTGAKKLKARLAFDNVFGWLAFGFADPEGNHNGMNGANIILAMPGGDYSASSGMDMNVGASINTYMIDPDDTSFRHWADPVESEENDRILRDFEDTGCHTAITFETDHINGQVFNLSGTDELIWAGNHMDHFMGYHGRKTRARFTLDWTHGVGKEEVAIADNGEHDDSHSSTDGDDMEVKSVASVKSIAVVMYVALASAAYYL